MREHGVNPPIVIFCYLRRAPHTPWMHIALFIYDSTAPASTIVISQDDEEAMMMMMHNDDDGGDGYGCA